MRGRGSGREREDRTRQWVPKTKLGQIVFRGEITTMSEAFRSGLPLREPEIVDILLPEIEDEVLDVNMVQRMTDSGRRVNFAITCVAGNSDGFVGVGRARGKEVGPAIRKAIDMAKLSIIEVKRGCGSWECGCYRSHSLPFKVIGRSGSVEVVLKPAPQGVGIAVGDVAKSIMRLAGVRDAWAFARGHTKTTVNFALAAFDALRQTSLMRVSDDQASRLRIRSGAEKVFVYSQAGVGVPAGVAPEGEAPPPAENVASEAPPESTKNEGEK
jgi:small subunit ribosomal protein S5